MIDMYLLADNKMVRNGLRSHHARHFPLFGAVCAISRTIAELRLCRLSPLAPAPDASVTDTADVRN